MTLFDIIFTGSEQALEACKSVLEQTIKEYGENEKVSFPNTAYSLPTIYAATGQKINTLADLKGAIGVIESLIVKEQNLEKALNAGLATAVAAEVIEACKYVGGKNPYEEPCVGFIPDTVIRSLGVPLVTGDIPGVAVVIGEAPTAEDAAKVIKDYQSKGILVTLVGKIIDQAIESKVKMGLEFRVVPLGYDVTSVTHIVSFAIRAALIFGNIKPGDLPELLKYTKERVPAFVNALGPLSELVVSAGAGAIALGFPVITDQDVQEVPMNLIVQKDYDKLVQTSLEARGIKIKITEIPIPVGFAPAFEGERVRKDEMFAEFGGGRTTAWELVRKRDLSEVEDHKIEVIGPDIDTLGPDGGKLPLAIIVDVAGKNMEEDFEPVMERRIHYFVNYIEGVMHIGQRDIAWVRISKSAYEAGFRLKHIGEVLYAKMLDEFGNIADKVQVTIITDKEQVEKLLNEVARPKYEARDARLAGLTDESVDTFYSCLLCQSFAPAHVCIVTPERLGLCGAVSWLDAKATYELNPTGPCQPIVKGECLDEVKGSWESINKRVAEQSHGATTKVNIYTIMEDPMTSCGCFECICGIMPEANGVIIVNREYHGMTPLGMTFGELASTTGGGVQTPGFMGHGRQFITSKKFLYADGGLKRVVWMPKELKEALKDKLIERGKEMGIENFYDMIADEEVGTDPDSVVEFLTKVGHPALSMDPMF
ncbi:acetyl-CoA decarbonylase/synthase complex subunit alpha/beta [Tepidanaerobacter syntrophicus]|uniref:CO-methylating acetyl-CoA synthase n=1 Tax=Tepidanaerobacter syntrophicus TaxID=224999 RepID=A0A0U9HH14_9FIRM|nr:acetyl-CoA decarbonylase/synthase complex subunit alpha/beta [Tepidanaerobacter syntrophicus]GAQ25188.1 acetyl-CoA synthase [Tepidanaerobacter syntrophicus]HHV82330.1 CO dehydrogenase/CO-methylating acetyl-CoA synthase complex subunit beta [Tepidanaerobacter syntrophicus]